MIDSFSAKCTLGWNRNLILKFLTVVMCVCSPTEVLLCP